MDLTKHYPFGIEFYKDIDFISVTFKNTTKESAFIYFYSTQKDGLAGIINAYETKQYCFPEKNKLVSITHQNKNFILELEKDMFYTIP